MAYKDYRTPKGDWFSRFLWKVAGAERYILERGTFSDQVKWACMGGIVLSTGLMAAFAGGYAFYTIFQPKGLALTDTTDIPTAIKAAFFGLIWGLIIFNIDRFIVAATGKGDGTEKITTDEWKSAIPRIIMGTIIAITISKPIEIRIFKSEIDLALFQHQQQLVDSGYAEVDRTFDIGIAGEKAKISKWQGQLSNSESAVAAVRNRYMDEGQNGGFSDRAKHIKAELDILVSEDKVLHQRNEANMDAANALISKFNADKQTAHQRVDKEVTKLDGLLERIKLAHKVAGPWISGFIMALFLAIELTPIFFKMMLIRGPYDYLEENLKEIVKARQGVHVEQGFYPDRQGKERDKVVYHFADMERRVAAKQAQEAGDLAEHALQRWSEKERDRINENPDAFVHSDPEA